jgi:hypothetical protein
VLTLDPLRPANDEDGERAIAADTDAALGFHRGTWPLYIESRVSHRN